MSLQYSTVFCSVSRTNAKNHRPRHQTKPHAFRTFCFEFRVSKACCMQRFRHSTILFRHYTVLYCTALYRTEFIPERVSGCIGLTHSPRQRLPPSPCQDRAQGFCVHANHARGQSPAPCHIYCLSRVLSAGHRTPHLYHLLSLLNTIPSLSSLPSPSSSPALSEGSLCTSERRNLMPLDTNSIRGCSHHQRYARACTLL